MKVFLYQAVKEDGERLQGVVEARTKQQAVDILRGKRLLITSLEDQESKMQYQLSMRLSHVSQTDIIHFTRQFASMIDAGLPMTSALQLLQKKTKPAMSKVISDVSAGIEGGQTLYKSMQSHPEVFTPLYLSLVKAGEMAGVLGEVLTRLAESMENQREFTSKVKSSMMYPAIVTLAMIGVGIIMVFFVMPKMSSLYEEFDADLPIMTSIVLGVSEFIRVKWYFFLIIIASLVAGAVWWLKSPEGKKQFDQVTLKIPYIGELLDKVISTTVISTLALLIKSGVSIVDSLGVVSQISSNSVYRNGIEKATTTVEKGMTLSSSFAREAFFPDAVIQMMSVGEETGRLDEMLDRIASQYEKDSLLALKALTSAIEPAMIVILGIGVGVMVISIIVPIYNLTSQF
ncbi:type II secretion system F family protein [Candidatus Beckwithbacteria bacterium]|nr:type II secretion system F family protein [Candidatus Beckwithbacteria bacterium]